VPGFKPQWTARKGAHELYNAYREIGLSLEDLQRGRYIRLRNLERLMKSGAVDATLRWLDQPAVVE
jgi:hypothetical protein